jgi:hypothetical protein
VLSGMLLHVIPTPLEVNVLPDTSAGFQRLREVVYALEALALDGFDLDRFIW